MHEDGKNGEEVRKNEELRIDCGECEPKAKKNLIKHLVYQH